MNGLMITGTHTGCGKTSITLAILAVLKSRGLRVASFKAGPDFIDPLFHQSVTGFPSYNLDPYLLEEPVLRSLFARHSLGSDLSLVEGAMGFFDGLGRQEIGSSAHLAQVLTLPVVLVVDCTAQYQSAAAVVAGFQKLMPPGQLAGVILNQVTAGASFSLLKDCIEEQTGVPVLGHLSPLPEVRLESRHLGLVQAEEVERLGDKVSRIAQSLSQTLDWDKLLSLASACPDPSPAPEALAAFRQNLQGLRIGLAWDKAFRFYYQDNLELLEQCGARLVRFSPLNDEALPPGLDALYLGGGYPEVFARQLTSNETMRSDIRAFAAAGRPVLAECGGLMYLGRTLQTDEGTYTMAGVLPVGTQMTDRLQHFGYTEIEFEGVRSRCHEFHYSRLVPEMPPGSLIQGKVLAGYAHLHFWSNPQFFARIAAWLRARPVTPPKLSLEPAQPVELAQRSDLNRYMAAVQKPDKAASAAAQARLDDLTKPLGSLGLLEETVIRLAGITDSESPRIDRKCILVFCADNGVTVEGVSSCPTEVTASVTGNFTRGLTGVNVFARLAGSALRVIDMGVDADLPEPGIHSHKIARGTANMAVGPAMSEQQVLRAIGVGLGTVATLKAQGYQLLGTGEMGIGNTSTSSALTAVLTGLPLELVVGRGSGLSDEALERKIRVIEKSLEVNQPDPADPLGVLAKVGGFDLAGLVGAYLGAAVNRLPIVIDGFITTAAALVAVRMFPEVRDYLFASHGSAEPGSSHALAALGLKPMLDLGLRLGEGTGAALAFPLFDAALAAYYQMGSFSDAKIEAYVPQK